MSHFDIDHQKQTPFCGKQSNMINLAIKDAVFFFQESWDNFCYPSEKSGQSIIRGQHSNKEYLLTERGIKNPAFTKSISQSHRTTEDPAKAHILSKYIRTEEEMQTMSFTMKHQESPSQ